MEKVEEYENKLSNLKKWLFSRIDNPNFRVQVNFFIKNTSEHECVTISGSKKFEITSNAVDSMEERIRSLKNNDVNRKGT